MTYLEELHQFEDQEQARAVSHPPITVLCHGDTGRVLLGQHRRRHIDELVSETSHRFHDAGHFTDCRITTIRPWWRFGRPTVRVHLSLGARR